MSKNKELNILPFLKDKAVSWIRFVLVIIAILLLNVAGYTLFFRLDLTANRQYSLSRTSREVVSNLEEPLTIKIYLSENLPSPYNNLHQDLRDMLDIYRIYGNKFFNYSIYTIRMGDEADFRSQEFQEDAAGYGINPIQVQDVSYSEYSVISVYMGMVILSGEMQEVIPVLNPGENMELLFTRSMQKLTERSSKLLSLEEPIKTTLVLSSSLFDAAPGLEVYPRDAEEIVGDISRRNYGLFEFNYLDPDSGAFLGDLEGAGLQSLAFDGHEVYASLVLSYGDNVEVMDLLVPNEQGYQILTMDVLERIVETAGLKVCGITSTISYLADHGTPATIDYSAYGYPNSGPTAAAYVGSLMQLYNVQEIYLSEETLPSDAQTLIINGPKEPFTEWELYQIDQYLMKGNNIVVFLDPYQEIVMDQQMGGQPIYLPLQTGLEKLLQHYGVSVDTGYVLDKQCLSQYRQTANGGVEKLEVFFAPLIGSENMNKDFAFMKGLSQVLVAQAGPLAIDPDAEESGRVSVLLSSSEEAWLMQDYISLDPYTIFPPGDDQLSRYPLAAILDGPFTSYYQGKDIPVPEAALEEADSGNSLVLQSSDDVSARFVESSERGRIFIMGTSSMTLDGIFENNPQSQQSLFMTDIVDVVNGQEDFALMRNKGQNYTPIREGIPEGIKLLIRLFNLLLVPGLVLIAGLIVLLVRSSKKRKIRNMFKVEGKNRA